MSDFTSSRILGFGNNIDDSPANIVLNFFKNNWDLQEVPKFDSITAPNGVLFGIDYYGYNDFVCYAYETQLELKPYSTGGCYDTVSRTILFCFTIRDYGLQQGDKRPAELDIVKEYISNIIYRNPKALKTISGFNFMNLISISDQHKEMYGQQVFELEFEIKLYYGKINIP